MGRKRTPGLFKRRGIWHVDKQIFGRRVCQSTGAANLEEAERFLARLMEEIRQAKIYGVRPSRTFEQAAAKFVLENQHKRSIASDIGRLKLLVPYIGEVALDRVHTGALQPWIDQRRKDGVAAGTINHGLKVVRRILNLAASEWIDEYGLTWLAAAPKIKLLPDNHKRQPYPLSWEEQNRLFKELPAHLAEMALFAVNTGCRDSEICQLQWDWEVKVPSLVYRYSSFRDITSRMEMNDWWF
jgi:integrase